MFMNPEQDSLAMQDDPAARIYRAAPSTMAAVAFLELAGGPGAGRKYLAYQIGAASAAFPTMIRFRVPVGMTGMQFFAQISAGAAYSGAISVAEVAIYNLTTMLPVG